MDVRVVRVGVPYGAMVVRVAVGFAGRVARAVGVLVVFVVGVGVCVRHRLMVVFVAMSLR